MNKPTLVLLPNFLAEDSSVEEVFPAILGKQIKQLNGIIAESEKNARKYMLSFLKREEMVKINIFLLNEHSQEKELKELVRTILKGGVFGLISDQGLPCIADPGAKLVFLMQQHPVEIKLISGPSSITQALILSGFCGQRFAFLGYLPKDSKELEKKIKELEQRSRREDLTQIFIETPYRSDKMLKALLLTLQLDTLLCVAINLTGKNQKVYSMAVKKWKNNPILIGKEPCVFLIYAKNF